MEISLADALKITSRAEIGGMIQVPIQSKEFGRIATQNAKNVILQKIREEERKVLYDEYYGKEKRSSNRYCTACDGQECKHQSW